MNSRIERKLINRLKRASNDYDMLAPDDRVMVCMSGGKDSYGLLHLLLLLKRRLPWPISIVAVNLDQGHPGFPRHVLPEYFESIGVEYEIVERDTLSIVKDKLDEGSTYCSLCSRLRRGILYKTAERLGATKIALGHHRDDIIETAMINFLYGGKLATMPPRLLTNDGKHVVIRPLAYCPEDWMVELSEEIGFPIIPCNLCGSQENLKRQQVKAMLKELNDENPFVKRSMMAALANVSPSHLMDQEIYDKCGVDHYREGERKQDRSARNNQRPAPVDATSCSDEIELF